MRTFPPFLLSVCLFVSAAVAQTTDDVKPVSGLSKNTLAQVAKDPDRFIQNAIRQLYQVTATGELTYETIETRRRMTIARQRANLLNQILTYDLDSNLAVESDEIAIQMPLMDSNQKAALDVLVASSDLNADGGLSLQEILTYVEIRSGERVQDLVFQLELLSFDANADGKVTPQEIGAVVNELSGRNNVTARNTGIASSDGIAEQFTACQFPKPSENAEIILVTGYEGAFISPVAVTGQDRETSSAVLTIEEGERPLYVVSATHDSIVWKIEGNTERVEAFVGSVGRSGVGVVGLMPEIVHFVPQKDCVPKNFVDASTGEALRAKRQLAHKLDREVSRIIATYRLGSIQLPSGEQAAGLMLNSKPVGDFVVKDGKRYFETVDGRSWLQGAQSGAKLALEAMLETWLRRNYPGGVAEISATDVVASSEAVAYDVMSQQAGLLQLVREGSLEMTSDGYYLIKEPISRFPSGLNGGHSVKFILGKGVEMPAGSSGHSEVSLEKTGECVSGVLCR